MEKYNLTEQIDSFIEETVFKGLKESRIAITNDSGDFEFLVKGDWIKFEQWGRGEENKETIKKSFKNNETVLFFDDMFEFCKWYVENKGEDHNHKKYKVVCEE